MPVVSASEMPSKPSATKRSTKSMTTSSCTCPSKGHPNVVDRLIVIFMPAACAPFTISGSSASDCSCVRLMLARLWVSDADTTAFSSSAFLGASAALRTPRTFGTSATYTTPGTRSMPARTSLASASAGTALGETNEVTSILCRPVRASWFTSSTLVAVGTNRFSIWKPSRTATSLM